MALLVFIAFFLWQASLFPRLDSKAAAPATAVQDHAESPLVDMARLKGINQNGELRRFGETDNCRAILFCFMNSECDVTRSYFSQLNQLAQACRTTAIEVYGVLPAAAPSDHISRQVDFDTLFDVTGELYTAFLPTHTPEIILVSDNGYLVYRGPIGNDNNPAASLSTELLDALRAVVQGKPTSKHGPSAGTTIDPGKWKVDPSKIAWAQHVAPIIQANCIECHHDDGVAPISFASNSNLLDHWQQILDVVNRGIMPPWKPHQDHGDFRGSLRLSPTEIKNLNNWKPPQNRFGSWGLAFRPKSKWQLGQPDLIIEMPTEFEIPTDGPDVYQYFVIPSGLKRDRLIAAIEFLPGNRRALHHASFRYDDAGLARKLDQNYPGPGYQRFGGWGFGTGGTLGGWALGVTPRRFPKGYGRFIAAGSDFVLQCHYHPTGKPETDRSQIGIYFAEPTANRRIGELYVANMSLDIPPGAQNHIHDASYTLPVDTVVHSVLPHMHLLGREAEARAVLPDKSVRPLIRIDDWDFDWQAVYHYRQPLRLPAGTRIDVRIVYDNSSANPFNPHSPPRRVRWGEESSDEMGVCFFDVTTDRPEELDFLLRHNVDYIERQNWTPRTGFLDEQR